MKNIMKNFYGIAMTVYGGFMTALIGWLMISNDICIHERYELLMVMTGIPALIHGLSILKKIWIAKALSEKDKELEETKQSMELTVVDDTAA